ncbi:hypothetical protein ACFXGR_23130 [Streptomyces mirabilis]|uniref:hypothetical protein n=1 Tax=Streptomyces mirabilis TaxID=68239 RepID=UPI0036CACF4B
MAQHPLLESPAQVTESASSFYAQHFTNMMTYSLGEMLLKTHDEFLTHTGKVFSTDDQTPREVFPEHFSRLDKLSEYVKESRPARLEMALSRSVDNFLSYVSDILTQAIITRPDLLKTQEQVSLEEVLNHASLEDFVRWAAERRVNQLSFKGLSDIAQYVEKRLGMTLHSSEDDWTSLNEAVAVRNIIVHRRAIIDERFLWSIKDSKLTVGQKYEVPREKLAQAMKCTMRIVHDFDSRIAEKFDLPLVNSCDQPWFERVHGESKVQAGEDDA